MKIATWNINSIKARLSHVLSWVKESSPDIVLLQETKVLEENFPAMEFEELGYNLAVAGQKTYNGVAILSKYPIEIETKALPGDESDPQARYIEGIISLDDAALRVASVYVPNGQAVGSEKFAYKMAFFDRLYAHIQKLLEFDEMLVIGGDYNVAPEPLDVYDPKSLDGSVCFHPDERAHFRKLLNLGLTEAWRALHPQEQKFSWWDYRGGGWAQNKGLRIDHLLLSPQAADKLKSAEIDEAERGKEKASDHAPVWCTLSL